MIVFDLDFHFLMLSPYYYSLLCTITKSVGRVIDPRVVENPFENVVSFEFPSDPTPPTMFTRTPQQAFQILKRMSSHIKSYKLQLEDARRGIEAARARLTETQRLLVMSNNQLEFVRKFLPHFANKLFIHESVSDDLVDAYRRSHPQVVVHYEQWRMRKFCLVGAIFYNF